LHLFIITKAQLPPGTKRCTNRGYRLKLLVLEMGRFTITRGGGATGKDLARVVMMMVLLPP